MKNYDIKSAIEELGNKEVRISKNRIAFLVPNMFERVRKGFLKFVPKKQVVEETPVQESVVPPVQEVPVQPVETPVQQPVQDEKNYTLKNKVSDMAVFNNQTNIVGRRPLLISVAFKSKLVLNRANKMINDVVNKVEETVTNSIDEAVNKYHELIAQREEFISRIKEIEQQITILVKENHLTQEQVTRQKTM